MKHEYYKIILALATLLGTNIMVNASEADGVTNHEAVVKKSGGSTQSHANLAEQATNPLSPMIQIQLQNYFIFDTIDGGYSNQIIVQPVIPIKAMGIMPRAIFRPTLPIVSSPDMDNGVKGTTGTGDLAGVYMWAMDKKWGTMGLGLAGAAPLASNHLLGARKWTVGPAFFFMNTQTPKLQWGALVFNTFSVGGGGASEVNSFSMQLIFNYHFGEGWYAGWGDQAITFDWQNNDAVYFPLSARLGKVFSIGKQKINMNGEFIFNVGDRTPGRDEWGFKLTVTPLFPES